MTKIAIIGNAGGGKSRLARELSHILEIELTSIDVLQWKPGWVQAPRTEMERTHRALMERPTWIIDGWGDQDLIEKRFELADTLILVDFPLWRHYFWAGKRHLRCLFRAREDGPKGCPMWPITWKLIRLMWWISRNAMPRLRAQVQARAQGRNVFHVRHPKELARVLALAKAVRT